MADHPVPVAARALTAEEHDDLVERCTKLERDIVTGLKAGNAAWWQTAQPLWEFHQEHGWTVLGYESVMDWAASPHIGMAYSSYTRMVRNYHHIVALKRLTFEQAQELPPMGTDIVLHGVRRKGVDFDEAIADAKSLSVRDLMVKYKGASEEPAGDLPTSVDGNSDGEVVVVDGEVVVEDEPPPQVERNYEDVLTAVDEAWNQLADALDSGAQAPRIRRDTLQTIAQEGELLAALQREHGDLVKDVRMGVIEHGNV